MSERVYVISAGPTMQKVGIADDPVSRLLAMQTGCPLRLSVVLSLETKFARSVEQAVHLLFAGQRIRGEWFSVDTITAVQAVCILAAQREEPPPPSAAKLEMASGKLMWVESETTFPPGSLDDDDSLL